MPCNWAEIRKTFPAAALILALLFSALAGIQIVDLGRANPFQFLGVVPPDEYTKPPTITIFAPQNNTAHTMNTISFSINVSLPESPNASGTFITEIYYEADWQRNRVLLYDYAKASFDNRIESSRSLPRNLYFQYSQDLTGIPEGKHSILVFAGGGGSYLTGGMGYYRFWVNDSSSVFFTIDTTPPSVSVLSVENKTYESSEVQLNFAVSEPFSQVTYSLDGQDNVTVAGNATLTGLTDGPHNIKIYAKDAAGNIGASETVYFSVDVPFPTTFVAVASGASVAVVGIGLIVYFKKRKR